MSNICKEFKGWFKSFTKTEIFLCTLQAIFITVFITLLTYIILHLLSCLKSKQLNHTVTKPNVITTESVFTEDNSVADGLSESEQNAIKSNVTNEAKNNTTEEMGTSDQGENINDMLPKKEKKVTNESLEYIGTKEDEILGDQMFKSEITCTWKPSQKTKMYTHYFENDKKLKVTKIKYTKDMIHKPNMKLYPSSEDVYKKYLEDIYEEEKTPNHHRGILLALVKKKPSQDFTFGCTLTIISYHWTVTAASCIQAIEEVDSLDSFAMMDRFGKQNINIHEVSDVKIHPQYLGMNNTYDLAVLKSEDTLVEAGSTIVTLSTILDYYLVTIGERLSILGYGTFRNSDENPLSSREVHVFNLPLSQCPSGTGPWSPRHLSRGTPVQHGTCGVAPICAGVLQSRTLPCNYCAGTPILKHNLLLGVMSDNQHCGLSCEPALYVNLALVRDWIDSAIYSI